MVLFRRIFFSLLIYRDIADGGNISCQYWARNDRKRGLSSDLKEIYDLQFVPTSISHRVLFFQRAYEKKL